MLTIRKRYLLDDKQRPIAVQLDLKTFRKIEESLEDHGLLKAMQEVKDQPRVGLSEARKVFSRMRGRK